MADSTQRRTWLEKAVQGDPVAVASLLAAYYPALRARAGARMEQPLKAKLDPEDVLQEVYLDVFRQIGGYENRGPDSFLNWVMTILDSKLVDARRALHRKKRDIAREVPAKVAGGSESYFGLLDQLYADSTTPSRVIRKEEAVGALMACMSGLSGMHRRVLQLRFLEGRSVKEVARQLDKSEDAVVGLTRNAIKALRHSMDRVGEFTHG